MLKEYQVTLFCENGKYKPVSCIVKADTEKVKNKSELLNNLKVEGITKICQKRLWSTKDLKKYGYTKIKMREYNKEKIEKEKAEKYEEIKKENGWN